MGSVYNATAFRTCTAISRLSKSPGGSPSQRSVYGNGSTARSAHGKPMRSFAEADLVTSYHGLNDIHADVVQIAATRDSLAHLKVAAS